MNTQFVRIEKAAKIVGVSIRENLGIQRFARPIWIRAPDRLVKVISLDTSKLSRQ